MMQRQQKQEFEVAEDGFSSEEEVKHEEIIFQRKKQSDAESKEKQEFKLRIPPPPQRKKNNYSLHPDLETGWVPKADLPVPVPMLFDNPKIDNTINRLIDRPSDKVKLCYLGPRFQNTFYAWYDKSFTFPYTHIRAPQNMKFTNRTFCGQHWEAQDGLIFDSFFQSGNLDCALRVGDRQYDLFLRVDSNTRGHLHWFNFKVKNFQKLQKYRFNICNFQKCQSLYNRGMRPYIFSKKKHQKQKIGWEQGGQSVKYEIRPSKASKLLSFQLNSFKLSFEYYTEYAEDEVQFSYCIPYTYTDLSETLHSLKKINEKSNHKFLQINKLCSSLGGLEVPLLIIHQESNWQNEELSKKCVVISGRAHPGESNGSHMMEGFLKFLCGECKEAVQLRKSVIFKIVPMLNPDGVALGNYRTGLSGRDFNRQYYNPDKTLFPQVYSFKKMVSQNKAIFKQNLLMFLDFHGHSIKKNVFMYGPQFPIIHRNYMESRIFPKIIGNNTCMFRYYSCSFKIAYCKETTARAIFQRRLGIPFSYTIQASNGSYYDHERLKDIPFGEKLWVQMGRKIGISLTNYYRIIFQSQKNRLEKLKNKKKKKDIIIKKSNHKITPKKQFLMLSGIEDEEVKHLFEEIKIAEDKKKEQKISDDEISEGSSDNEGKQDDLPADKMQEIYKMIKKKKYKIGVQQTPKIKVLTQENKVFFTEQEETNEKKSQFETKIKPLSSKRARKTFIKDNHANFCISSEDKDQKAAKIINFSFINTKKLSKASEVLTSLKERRNLFQLYMIEKNEKKQAQSLIAHQYPTSGRVLDLSTYKQKKKEAEKFRHRHILRQGYSVSCKNSKKIDETMY